MRVHSIDCQLGRLTARLVLAAALLVFLSALPAVGDDPPPDATGATHQQTKVIPMGDDSDWRLACFCLTKDGRIVAALSRPEKPVVEGDGIIELIVSGDEQPAKKPLQAKPEPAKPDAKAAAPGEVRLLDPDGKLLKKWPLDFEPQAVSVGPEDTLYLAGDGVLARFDMTGKQRTRSESPQVVAARKDPKGLEKRARATLEEQRDQFKQVIKSLQAQKEEINGKDDKSLTEEERSAKATLDQQIEVYKQMDSQKSREITDAEVKATMAQLAKSDRRVNAIAAGVKYVYTTTRASKGYGFRVWRSDLDFANAKQIAEGLSGCCGQMDVQCCGDDVVVAENSRYRVVRYGPEGKKLASFGKSSRDGGGDGFNGCCNPMNTRAVGDNLYVSESNGLVKLFTKDGTYKGVVGLAKVRAGCKSSIVDVSPDGNRVYYIDVVNSAICVLERTPGVKTAVQ
jgi:hypothetical protein